MSDGLPRAVNTEHEFLAAVCTRLDRLYALIDERLPGQATQPETPAEVAGPQPVELREPDQSVTAEPAPAVEPVELREPESSPALAGEQKTTRAARATGRRSTKAGR